MKFKIEEKPELCTMDKMTICFILFVVALLSGGVVAYALTMLFYFSEYYR